MLTWQRYFFKEVAKIFSLFIFSFFFLYALIDYSTHVKAFHKEHISFIEIFLYYLYQLTNRADILIPFGLLIAAIKVLTKASVHHEIVALVAGGIPLKSILRPFFGMAVLLMTLMYGNFQFLQPFSLHRLEYLEEHFIKHRSSKVPENIVCSMPLIDHSLLLYQQYDRSQETFSDAYWVKNFDEIFHIQTLYPFEKIPQGEFVDRLVRNAKGELELDSSHTNFLFPEMIFDPIALFTESHPPHFQSLTQLFSHMGWEKIGYGLHKMSDREAEVATIFLYKLLVPFVCLLVIIIPAPFCLRYSRSVPIFIIYALSLFGLITFFTLLNASVILGKSQVIPPLWSLAFLSFLCFLLSGYRYAKL